MINKKFARDLNHYLPLFGIMAVGVAGFYYFSYDNFFRIVITIATATGYVVWGVVHHKLHDDLYFAVFLEYLLIASLGVIVILSLLIRG